MSVLEMLAARALPSKRLPAYLPKPSCKLQHHVRLHRSCSTNQMPASVIVPAIEERKALSFSEPSEQFLRHY
jgi:hypothetical protein